MSRKRATAAGDTTAGEATDNPKATRSRASRTRDTGDESKPILPSGRAGKAPAGGIRAANVVEIPATGVFVPAGSGTAGRGGRFLLLGGVHEDERGTTTRFDPKKRTVLTLDFDAEQLFPNKYKRVGAHGEELDPAELVEVGGDVLTQPSRTQFQEGQIIEEPPSAADEGDEGDDAED